MGVIGEERGHVKSVRSIERKEGESLVKIEDM
jgi:hypothetical protein